MPVKKIMDYNQLPELVINIILFVMYQAFSQMGVLVSYGCPLLENKRHAMHAEAMTFHKGSLRIFRKFDSKFQES